MMFVKYSPHIHLMFTSQISRLGRRKHAYRRSCFLFAPQQASCQSPALSCTFMGQIMRLRDISPILLCLRTIVPSIRSCSQATAVSPLVRSSHKFTAFGDHVGTLRNLSPDSLSLSGRLSISRLSLSLSSLRFEPPSITFTLE